MGEVCRSLRDEHRVIERVLDAMASEAVRLEAEQSANPDFLRSVFEFFDEYVDGFHHLKEETILYPMLERSGLPRGNSPIDQLISDHIDGRALMSAIGEMVNDAVNGHPEAMRRLADGLRTFVTFLRRHMEQEENMLYPMAEQMIKGPSRVEVEKTFAGADEQMTDAMRRDRSWAESLAHLECPTGITEPAELVWEESDLYV